MKQPLEQEPDWEEVLYRYQDMVYHLALVHTKSATDADDVFQEVFLRLVRKNPAFESEDHRKAWLIRTTLNCCNSFWNSAWKRRTVSMEECGDAIDIAHWGEGGVLELIDELPPRYRTVIHLFYYEDMPIEQIGRALKISYNAAAKRLSRARELLRKKLEGGTAYAGFSEELSK